MTEKISLIAKPDGDYRLLDSGEGEKLEKFGPIILSRPDPQALWRKKEPSEKWQKASACFSQKEKNSGWKINKKISEEWKIEYAGLNFSIHLGAFKHTGLFPEQAPNWQWMQEKISQAKTEISVLNLFAYTGGASIAAAKAGAKVCHLDSSKAAISWARKNALLNNLKEDSIRWILDDAKTFVKREVRRKNKYDGIIMDPPAFGRGAKAEVWKIEDDFLELLDNCFSLLCEKPLFFIANGYAAGYSPEIYINNLNCLIKKFKGRLEAGELFIEENSGRLLPAGIFGRWSAF